MWIAHRRNCACPVFRQWPGRAEPSEKTGYNAVMGVLHYELVRTGSQAECSLCDEPKPLVEPRRIR